LNVAIHGKLSPLTATDFLKNATAVPASAYGLSPAFALAAPVPEKFDGSGLKLKAPEPNAKSGGVLRHGMPRISGGSSGQTLISAIGLSWHASRTSRSAPRGVSTRASAGDGGARLSEPSSTRTRQVEEGWSSTNSA
jgi:hypothetical protein